MLQVLQEYERGIILRLGRVVSNRPKGPGMCGIKSIKWVNVRFYVTFLKQRFSVLEITQFDE